MIEMVWQKWQDEYLRLLLDRFPDFDMSAAKTLAMSEEEYYSRGWSPEEALNQQVDSWDDDEPSQA